jgi:hypothetical protein
MGIRNGDLALFVRCVYNSFSRGNLVKTSKEGMACDLEVPLIRTMEHKHSIIINNYVTEHIKLCLRECFSLLLFHAVDFGPS